MNPTDIDLIDANHFWGRVDCGEADACWLWTGPSRGHSHGGYRGKWYAHRIAYELTHGSVPDGLVVRHSCDVPRCCNPAHLLLGTQADNVADAVERGRVARGEKQGLHKLTVEQVAEIRRRRAAGELRVVLAAEFGVSKHALFRLERGQTWTHVTDPPPGIFPNPPGQENRPTSYRKRAAA